MGKGLANCHAPPLWVLKFSALYHLGLNCRCERYPGCKSARYNHGICIIYLDDWEREREEDFEEPGHTKFFCARASRRNLYRQKRCWFDDWLLTEPCCFFKYTRHPIEMNVFFLSLFPPWMLADRAGHLRHFWIFSIVKMISAFLIELIWLGEAF